MKCHDLTKNQFDERPISEEIVRYERIKENSRHLNKIDKKIPSGDFANLMQDFANFYGVYR